MFGESDSESPRVPSPWDSLTPPSPSPPLKGIPRLVPEAEEGNVEYKLQLLSPTPARFARLVTQLKWRLLEGGGQAYYELGVADSGTLVGLPRQQLEESLETLEMMAGEIGASVIVVKEIEVPPELSSLAESQLERWDGRKSARRKDLLRMMKHDGSPIISGTELETDLSSTDVMDAEGSTCYSPLTPATSVEDETDIPPLKQSAIPLPFDPALAMFTMDMGEDVANYADNEGPDSDVAHHFVTEISVSLEISSVYKPRPMKKRATHILSPPSAYLYTKKLENGYSPSNFTDTTLHSGDSTTQDSPDILSQPIGPKVQWRRDKRDKRRELKPNTLLTHVPTRRSDNPPSNPDPNDTASFPADATDSLATDSPLSPVVEPPTSDTLGTTTNALKEPRLIVEALVVRKLSLDEAFLDFEGFSLQ